MLGFRLSQRPRYFHPTPPLWLFPTDTLPPKHIYTRNLRGFPADPHPLIKSDGSHWLQMKPISSYTTRTRGAADSCVCYPGIKHRAPVQCLPYDPSLFNALQLVSTQLRRGPWKYLSLLKSNNTALCYHTTDVSIPLNLSMLNEAKKTSCQETEE